MSVCRQLIPCSFAALAVLMAGCGGNAAAPGTPVPPNRLAAPPENQPGGVASPPRPAARAPVAAASKNESTLPDGVDPRDAVEISAIGPAVEILAPDAVLPGNLVTVVATIPADSLDHFQIATPAGAAGTTGTPATGFTLPSGFQAIRAAGYSDSGLPVRIVDGKAGAEMVLVSAGVSYLGTDVGPENARPRVPVLLDPFYIDVTEVTLAEYDRYTADQKELKRGRPLEPLNAGSPPTFPALGISWSTANAFAKWAGKDLPTEAEFEKAARGPDGFRGFRGGTGAACGLTTENPIRFLPSPRTGRISAPTASLTWPGMLGSGAATGIPKTDIVKPASPEPAPSKTGREPARPPQPAIASLKEGLTTGRPGRVPAPTWPTARQTLVSAASSAWHCLEKHRPDQADFAPPPRRIDVDASFDQSL